MNLYAAVLRDALNSSTSDNYLEDAIFENLSWALLCGALHHAWMSDWAKEEEARDANPVVWWCSEAFDWETVEQLFFIDSDFREIVGFKPRSITHQKLLQLASAIFTDVRSSELAHYFASCESEPNFAWEWIDEWLSAPSQMEMGTPSAIELLPLLENFKSAVNTFIERSHQ